LASSRQSSGSAPRTSVDLSKPAVERLFDSTLEFTVAGNNQDGVFRLEVIFDTSNTLSGDETIRVDEMAIALRGRISMWKRSNGRVVTKAGKADLTLGKEVMGFHELRPDTYMSISDMGSLARKPEINISVEEAGGTTVYKIAPVPIRRLLSKLGVRIQQMARDMTSWVVEEEDGRNLDFLTTSADLLQSSRHMLIGNIPTDLFISDREEILSRIEHIIQLSDPYTEITKETKQSILNDPGFSVHPGDIGVYGFTGGKASILVEVSERHIVGVSVEGGRDILSRQPMDSASPKGEYFTKQYLTDNEAGVLNTLRQSTGGARSM
jgi:hypothetical protein